MEKMSKEWILIIRDEQGKNFILFKNKRILMLRINNKNNDKRVKFDSAVLM
jgi:hypothetical protein